MSIYKTFNIEEIALRTYNYMENMVDMNYLPYFNVFMGEPSEAAHDWPDYGDVMTRALQSLIMTRQMTGERSFIEDIWIEKATDWINPTSRLLINPPDGIQHPTAELGAACLTLYAFATLYDMNQDEETKNICERMVDGIYNKWDKNNLDELPWKGFVIKSLMTVYHTTGYKKALELSGQISKFVLDSDTYSPDNNFAHGGHMHGLLRSLVGIADYALTAKEPVMYSRVLSIYQYVLSLSVGCGFLPEYVGINDIVACETCALMDFMGLTITLANHGHPEYYDIAEKLLRNHLVESQLTDGSWLGCDTSKTDTDQITYRNIGYRMVGGWAGWSSPNHFLAAEETLDNVWGEGPLLGKVRAFQNCCGGSGGHALFIAWKNASRFTNETLSVNLHIDKLLPEAEIRGYQPYKGLTTIKLKSNCDVKIRIPNFTSAEDMKISINNKDIPVSTSYSKIIPTHFNINNTNSTITSLGNYITIKNCKSNWFIEISYPLPVFTEKFTIGHKGRNQYEYTATWKGDTVIEMKPSAYNQSTGYSQPNQKETKVYYGKEGFGKLYERAHLLCEIEPELAKLGLDNGKLDFWYIK